MKASTPVPAATLETASAQTDVAAEARLEALSHYRILGSPPEEAFSRIVTMVGELFGTQQAHINFLDGSAQWSKAFYGGDASGVCLADSFCARAILQDEVFVVADAQQDPYFQNNPLVLGQPHIRFYAGAILKSQSGVNIGTLSILDMRPRRAFGKKQRALLQNFAAIVMDELELRLSLQNLARTEAGLHRAHSALAEKVASLQKTTLALHQANRKLHFDAYHDPLTGLPNRASFLQTLQDTMDHAERPYALLFLDFDGFKLVNDSLGHAVGDEVLVALAKRLRHSLKEDDLLARFGGDEFSVLLQGVTQDEAVATAERLRQRFRHPVMLQDRKLRLGVSIGVVASAFFYLHPGDMLQDADIAMYQAKGQGRGKAQGAVALFSARMRDHVVQRLSLEDELRDALKLEQLVVYYQPIIGVGEGGEQVASLEALVRWPHPVRGFVPPNEFIPVAEDAGLIKLLDQFVLREACRQVGRWHRHGLAVHVSVNLSSWYFSQPGLLKLVETSLRRGGLAAEQLTLELTERTLLEDSETLSQTLAQLKALGVKLALDDFGTGYSSLSYLQRVPLDSLKIDSSFVQGLTTTPKSAELVRTILALAEALGLAAVAEGVETPAQLEALSTLGCRLVQGFIFAPPLSAADTEAFLKRRAAPPVSSRETPHTLLIG